MAKYQKKAKTLTAKQAAFVVEYLIDFNAGQAAIRAGYSAKTARRIGHQQLHTPTIQAAIAAAMQARSERTAIDADWVLKRLASEADADLAELFDEAGNLHQVKNWPMVFRKGLIAGIEVNELFEGRGDDRKSIGLVKKIKLVDRTKLIELIGKHVDVRAFRDQIELSGKLSIADEIRKRRAERSG